MILALPIVSDDLILLLYVSNAANAGAVVVYVACVLLHVSLTRRSYRYAIDVVVACVLYVHGIRAFEGVCESRATLSMRQRSSCLGLVSVVECSR